MGVRLDVAWCARCKADRVVEVETLYFVPITTSTCQTCGHVATSEAEPLRPTRIP